MSALTLRISDTLDDQLRDLANAQSLSRSEIARIALENYVKTAQKEIALTAMIQAVQKLNENPKAQETHRKLNESFAVTEGDGLEKNEEITGWWK